MYVAIVLRLNFSYYPVETKLEMNNLHGLEHLQMQLLLCEKSSRRCTTAACWLPQRCVLHRCCRLLLGGIDPSHLAQPAYFVPQLGPCAGRSCGSTPSAAALATVLLASRRPGPARPGGCRVPAVPPLRRRLPRRRNFDDDAAAAARQQSLQADSALELQLGPSACCRGASMALNQQQQIGVVPLLDYMFSRLVCCSRARLTCGCWRRCCTPAARPPPPPTP